MRTHVEFARLSKLRAVEMFGRNYSARQLSQAQDEIKKEQPHLIDGDAEAAPPSDYQHWTNASGNDDAPDRRVAEEPQRRTDLNSLSRRLLWARPCPLENNGRVSVKHQTAIEAAVDRAIAHETAKRGARR